MHFDIERQFELGGATQTLAQDLFLDLELMLVAGMLIMAPAAVAKVGTDGLDPVRRTFDDAFNLCSGKSWLLFGEESFDSFSSEDKGDEYGFAAPTGFIGRTGGQAGQAVAAIDHLFDRDEQGLILQSGRAFNRRERRVGREGRGENLSDF